MRQCWNLSQPAVLVIGYGLPDLFLRVHYERPVAGDGLVDRLAVHHEDRGVGLSFDFGLVPGALEHDEFAFAGSLAVHADLSLHDKERRRPALAQGEARAVTRAQLEVEQVDRRESARRPFRPGE